MLSRALILLFLSAAAFPRGGLCGGREEVTAKGWTLDLLIERFNESENALIAYSLSHPSSGNWGGGDETYFCMLLNKMEKLGDRAALPFLEKKSLMETIPRVVRSRAAEVYVSLATAGECAVFLPKILQIDDEDKRIISWRSRVLPACLKKIEASIAKNELPAETLAVLTGKLLMFTQSQSVYNTGDCDSIDQFLVRHCADYSTSGQRFAMWTNHLGQISQIPWKGETIKKYTPLKESLESLPANRRVDLRKQFPDLPPLPEEKVSGVPWKTALGTVAGAAALAAAGAWLAARRRKWHETE